MSPRRRPSTLYNVDGVTVGLESHSAATTASLDCGLVGLYRSMRIHANPTDWT